jgi:hypothetical protein
LAGWSSSGGTTSGRSPVEAGLKNPVATPVKPANSASVQTSATPAIRRVAVAPWLATRARSAAIITERREVRSPTTPPISTLPASGRTLQARTRPTSDADPPTSSTAKASATATMRSPSTETP